MEKMGGAITILKSMSSSMGRIIPYIMGKMFVGYCLTQKPPERTLNPFFILNGHPKHGLLANSHIWKFPN
jgi:hypothetical protein